MVNYKGKLDHLKPMKKKDFNKSCLSKKKLPLSEAKRLSKVYGMKWYECEHCTGFHMTRDLGK